MKQTIFCLSMILTLSVLPCFSSDDSGNSWGVVTNNLQMSIILKPGQQELKTNEPVKLLVAYRNVSTNETVIIYDTLSIAVDATYSFSVTSPSGKDISPRPIKWYGGSGGSYPVAPGGIREFEIDLSKVCGFKEPGTYNVVVKKVILPSNNHDWFTVVSNPLQIRITN